MAHWQDGKAAADHCSCAPAEGDGEEKTYTDNISPRENDSPAIQGIPLLFGWDLAKMRGEGANKPDDPVRKINSRGPTGNRIQDHF